MGIQVWRHVPGKTLFLLLNLFSAMALIYEGYNQGVFGAVSGTPGFISTMSIGADGVVTDPTKQGGLAASYYFGAIWGCLLGGMRYSNKFCLADRKLTCHLKAGLPTRWVVKRVSLWVLFSLCSGVHSWLEA